MALQEDVIDLVEFVAHELGEVEVLTDADVVGFLFGELLGFSDPLDSFYFGDNNFFLLGDGGSGGLLLRVDIDDEVDVVGVEAVEEGLGVDQFERPGPIELAAMGSHIIFK